MNMEQSRKLGKYELRERLGHGGMAEVWKARDTQLQRYVAIKMLHANLQADPSFVTRFQHEAQVIASLHHPNIVQIHDFQVSQPPESEQTTFYMVMAYIEGKTLAEYIASTSVHGQIPSPLEIVNMFTSICLAVDYAHQKGMIHRDIKPANILLDIHNRARNPMGEPILTDFGLAKLLGVSAAAMTGSQMGTPLYTSPEQARGYPGNERSDIYSLGIILYEMLTGVRPFRGDTPNEVLTQHLSIIPTSPVLFNPNIPPALTMVIMTALAKDPNARFARAVTMATAIAEALNVPVPEGLGPPAYPSDVRNMATYVSTAISQGGVGAVSAPYLANAAPLMSPASSGDMPSMTVGGTVQATSGQPAVTPAFWASPQVLASGGGARADHALQAASAPVIPEPPGPTHLLTPLDEGPHVKRGRRKGLYTVLVSLVLLALLGSGLGVYFGFFHKNSPPVAAPGGGQVSFLSSGQLNTNSAQGIADELDIHLQNLATPQAGKSYFVWLLGDKQPHVEDQPMEPEPQFTLPLRIGPLPFSQGKITYLYPGTPAHDNLLSRVSRMLVTEEDTNSKPANLSAEHSAWRYYAEIPQTPYGQPALSALDHIRHLFYKEAKVDVLGLPGGLDIWLFRNTEKVMEWSLSARDDYDAQGTGNGLIRDLLVSILDYLDGSPNVHLDIPGGPVDTNTVISQVALLSVSPVQTEKTDLTNNPPGYLDHVALHLNGVVSAPDATPQMRQLGVEIIEAINHAKTWLEQVRIYAKQLIAMDSAQLSQPAALAALDAMLQEATNAYIGQLDPQTNQVVPGVLQVHYDIQKLAVMTITTNLPATLS